MDSGFRRNDVGYAWASSSKSTPFNPARSCVRLPANAARLAANFMLSQECQAFLAKFGRIPTRKDVASNPPGIVELMQTKKVVTALLTPEEERKWQRLFDMLFKGR